MNKHLAGIAGLAAAVALAGCSPTIDGTPVAAETPPPPPHLDVSPECAHAAVTPEQLSGSWMRGTTSVITFGMDGSVAAQERAMGQRGTWSYHPSGPKGPCVVSIRWTAGFISGRSDEPLKEPYDWVLQPLAATPTSIDLTSVDGDKDPFEAHWWRWK